MIYDLPVFENLEDCPKYEMKEELGDGMHAIVFRAKRQNDGKECAVKILKKIRIREKHAEAEKAMIIEANILKKLNHDNIVKVFDAFRFKSEVRVVLEFLEGGELFAFLSSKSSMSEMESLYFAEEILKGVSYIHSQNIVHLDLKPENIMLRSQTNHQPIIVDFSLAKEVGQFDSVKVMQGTLEFCAPEILNYDSIGTFTDMWAIGVIFYILLTGCSPFLGDNDVETQSYIMKCSVDYEIDEFSQISSPAVDLIKSLLVIDRKKRKTAEDCLSHSWISNESKPKKEKSGQIDTSKHIKYVASARWKSAIKSISNVQNLFKLLKNPVTSREPPSSDNCEESQRQGSGKSDC